VEELRGQGSGEFQVGKVRQTNSLINPAKPPHSDRPPTREIRLLQTNQTILLPPLHQSHQRATRTTDARVTDRKRVRINHHRHLLNPINVGRVLLLPHPTGSR
jgi:hypothetical protein